MAQQGTSSSSITAMSTRAPSTSDPNPSPNPNPDPRGDALADGPEVPAVATAPARRKQLPSPRSRRLLLLAATGLLARVLASQPVYAYAPPAASAPTTTPTRTAAAPQKPGATSSRSEGKPADADVTSRPAATQPDASSKSSTPSTSSKDTATKDTTSKAPAKATKAKADPKATSKARGQKPGSKRGRNVIDEDFLVEGKLEKPNAYYILRRSKIDFDWARLDARFSPLVLESVQDPLF